MGLGLDFLFDYYSLKEKQVIEKYKLEVKPYRLLPGLRIASAVKCSVCNNPMIYRIPSKFQIGTVKFASVHDMRLKLAISTLCDCGHSLSVKCCCHVCKPIRDKKEKEISECRDVEMLRFIEESRTFTQSIKLTQLNVFEIIALECVFYGIDDSYLEQGAMPFDMVNEMDYGTLLVDSDFLKYNTSISELNNQESFNWTSENRPMVNGSRTKIKLHIDGINGLYDSTPDASEKDIIELNKLLTTVYENRCLSDVMDKIAMVYRDFNPGKKTKLLLSSMLGVYNSHQVNSIAKMAVKSVLYSQQSEYQVYGKHAANRVINSMDYFFNRSLSEKWDVSNDKDSSSESLLELLIKRRLATSKSNKGEL